MSRWNCVLLQQRWKVKAESSCWIYTFSKSSILKTDLKNTPKGMLDEYVRWFLERLLELNDPHGGKQQHPEHGRKPRTWPPSVDPPLGDNT
jgi:hypothetical protein